jgi:hypothetical protein
MFERLLAELAARIAVRVAEELQKRLLGETTTWGPTTRDLERTGTAAGEAAGASSQRTSEMMAKRSLFDGWGKK